MHRLAFWSFLFLLCSSAAASGDPTAPVFYYQHGPQDTPPIRFVGDHSYAPIEFLEDGQPKGIFPEFLPHLARAMGRNVEYRLVEWKEAQRMVREHEADVLTVFSPNPERNKHYAYSKEFLTFDFLLFVRSDDILIHTLDDLKGRAVAVTKGGTPREVIEAYSDKIDTRIINNIPEGFEQLLAGRVDAVATTGWVGAYLIQKHGFTGIKPVKQPFFSEAAPMGVRKDDQATLALINAALEQLEQTHVMAALTEQWAPLEVVYLTKGTLTQYKLALLGGLAGLLLICALFFILVLRRQVREKTHSLQHSLDELQRTQNRLIEVEKNHYLIQVVNGVAHELNTPLGNAITALSFGQQALTRVQQQFSAQRLSQQDFEHFMQQQASSLQHIDSALSQAARLVENFKLISVDQSQLRPGHFCVSTVIESVLSALDKELATYRPVIDFDRSINIQIYSIQSALFQVISQLVMNSLAHAFDANTQARIRFEQKQEDNQLLLIYSDNGKGVDPTRLKEMFQPFFTTERERKMVGLGLPLVYNLVTLILGGELHCYSAKDQGITFELRLPLTLTEPITEPQSAPA